MNIQSTITCLAILGFPAWCADRPVPLLLGPPERFPASTAGGGTGVQLIGQAAVGQRLDLTATNGFFDRCFVAGDPGPMIEGDEAFIRTSFGHLRPVKGNEGSARWHLWLPETGELTVRLWMTVPEKDAGKSWTIRLGEKSTTFQPTASDGTEPQAFSWSPGLETPGKHTLSLEAPSGTPPSDTLLHFIRLEGPAISKARLLRARWRPAAVHQRFEAPPGCDATDLWVFETRSVSETSSYSPLTTPFGYFGTSFKSGGRVPEGGSFNFSMWLASRGADHAPPIEKMPRILATGLPDATFSWFSHEGTGVKLRNAVAYPDGAERTIQAMRAEFADGLWTYYGYFYDESAARWKLFAAGRQPPKRGRAPDPTRGLLRSTGSFCEIPGPPQRERSGDLVRLVKRRGWFIDRNGTPHLAGMAAGRGKPSPPSSRRTWYMDDYTTEGWMAMATGGMELYPQGSKAAPDARVPLPDYLAPDKIQQLHRLPTEFGPTEVVELTRSSATIDCPLVRVGPNARARVYFGTVDALTYPAREISRGSNALKDMFQADRTWSRQTREQPVSEGPNLFQLEELQPNTRYYYRIRVEHDHGKHWQFASSSFQTP